MYATVTSKPDNRTPKRSSKKVGRTVIYVLAALLTITVAYFLGLRAYYHDFYENAKREFELPNLASGFVPQGFEYRENDDVFLISGYTTDGEESQIYIVHPEDGSYRQISVMNADGSVFANHSGGISSFGEYIYIAGCDGEIYVLTAEDVLDEGDESAVIMDSFEAYNEASFSYVKDNHLYVGEYYAVLKYRTPESHHLITPSGDNNKAIITVFELDENRQFGVNPVPVKAYSITGRIQGMSLTDSGDVVLSASSVFQGSQLYIYNYSTIHSVEGKTLVVGDFTIPLYYLDSASLTKTIEILPKSEGIVFYNSKIYMLFESATKRFKYGKLLDAQYVYSYVLD